MDQDRIDEAEYVHLTRDPAASDDAPLGVLPDALVPCPVCERGGVLEVGVWLAGTEAKPTLAKYDADCRCGRSALVNRTLYEAALLERAVGEWRYRRERGEWCGSRALPAA